MRDIDHQSEIVAARDDFFSIGAQAPMLAALVVGAVAEIGAGLGAVANIVMAVMRQAKITCAQSVIDVEKLGMGADRVAILDADTRNALDFCMQTPNAGGAARADDVPGIFIHGHSAGGSGITER